MCPRILNSGFELHTHDKRLHDLYRISFQIRGQQGFEFDLGLKRPSAGVLVEMWWPALRLPDDAAMSVRRSHQPEGE
jgi:hypothetical protein